MEFTRLESHELFVEGHADTEAAIIAELPAMLIEDEGMTPEAAAAAVDGATTSRTWFSPTAGFMHDCSLHLPSEAVPGCADSRAVTVVLLTPPSGDLL